MPLDNLEPCHERGCKARGVIRDEDTWHVYCWEHRQGITEQECGCEYDNRTYDVVEWCDEHWKVQARIIKYVTGRRPKRKPTKNELMARAKRKAAKKRKVNYAQFG